MGLWRHEWPCVATDAGANIVTKFSRKQKIATAAARGSNMNPAAGSAQQDAVECKPTKTSRRLTKLPTAAKTSAAAQPSRRLPDHVKRSEATADANRYRAVRSGPSAAWPTQSRGPMAVSLQINLGWRTDSVAINDDGQEI